MKRNDTEQALTDLLAAATAAGDMKAIAALKAAQEAMTPQLYIDADKIYGRHRYPPERLKYTKISRRYPIATLKASTLQVLILLIQIMSSSGLVQVSVNKLMMCLNVSSDNTIKSALKTLRKKGYISLIKASTSLEPAVYKVSPTIATVGKLDPVADEDSYSLCIATRQVRIAIKDNAGKVTETTFTAGTLVEPATLDSMPTSDENELPFM